MSRTNGNDAFLHQLNQAVALRSTDWSLVYSLESLKMRKKKDVSQFDFPAGSASVVIVEEEGRILAVSRKDNHSDLGLPGGKIEAGETPVTAACREALEEIGRIVCNPMLAGAATINDVIVFIYRAELIGQIATHVNHENSLVRWASPAEICSGTFGHFNKKYVLPLLSG